MAELLRPAVSDYIRSDLYRYSGIISFFAFTKEYLLNRSFKYSFWLRLCESKFLVIKGIAHIMHYCKSKKYGIQIPRGTKIGYGLYINHSMGLVVNPTTIIGNNCNLSQFTTIGANDGLAAEIGDCVYIGPGVSIVEHVKIGNGVTIGAGAIVTRDIPDYATAVGSPARVISFNNPSRYIINKYDIETINNNS